MILVERYLLKKGDKKNANKQTDGETDRPRAQPRPWSQPRATASTLIESKVLLHETRRTTILFTY